MQSLPPPRGVKVVQQIQVLCKDDTETLDLCKNMMKQEYVRDVDYLNKREADDGDSTMTLLSTNNTSKDLVICPDKRIRELEDLGTLYLGKIHVFVGKGVRRNAAHQTRAEHQATVNEVNVSPNQATHEDGTSQPTMDQAGTDEEEDVLTQAMHEDGNSRPAVQWIRQVGADEEENLPGNSQPFQAGNEENRQPRRAKCRRETNEEASVRRLNQHANANQRRSTQSF
ncbi:hypothetical protein BC332_17994 [Capsicum chinense]|nr:hypothetical protein BC332_17994 [Capsicum chinense]